jgi:hypothetical protein
VLRLVILDRRGLKTYSSVRHDLNAISVSWHQCNREPTKYLPRGPEELCVFFGSLVTVSVDVKCVVCGQGAMQYIGTNVVLSGGGEGQRTRQTATTDWLHRKKGQEVSKLGARAKLDVGRFLQSVP